jgi:hypothetical protein
MIDDFYAAGERRLSFKSRNKENNLNLWYSDFEVLKEAENEALDYPFLFFLIYGA